jgi:hypothetical protein
VVVCHGAHDPWQYPMQSLPWVQEAYC